MSFRRRSFPTAIPDSSWSWRRWSAVRGDGAGRRILYSMGELNLFNDKPYRKSARIVGEVMGKYHPHGDSSVYDALVRLAQDFSIGCPLVDGHGNFGSVDGDSPAAMRYTEARLSKIAGLMLEDIDKNTVDFYPNFDDTLMQPSVLPAKFPNLLVNGADGIAVGMATNIPPHNLVEVISGVQALIKNPDIEIDWAVGSYPRRCYITKPVCISEQEGSVLKGKNIVKLKENENSVYAIDKEGKVYSWGNGYHGILGDRQTEDRSYPVCISDLPDNVFNKIKIIDVVTNYGVAIAIDSNGNLYTWGGRHQFENSEETDILDPICLTEMENSGIYSKKITKIDNYEESDYDVLSVVDSEGNLYIGYSQLIYISEFEYNRNMADGKKINGETVNQIFYFEDYSLGIHYYLTDNENLYFSSEILGPR